MAEILKYNNVLSSKNFSLKASHGFENWLLDNNSSLCFSTYQSSKLFFVGLDANKQKISVFERTFPRCMGVCFNKENTNLYVSTLYQIWQLNNLLEDSLDTSHGKQKIFVPQFAHTTGNLRIHDIGSMSGKPVFVNTLFNCLSTTCDTHSFEVFWKPNFIKKILPEDHCHLNGLAMKSGSPFVVTAISTSDTKDGWRADRQDGGVVIDISNHNILVNGLSMPHSPRYYRNKIWLLNSGKGEFGYIEKDTFIPVVCCPGYLRGLSFVGDYAIVGLSLSRSSSAFQDLVLDSRLPSMGGERCGLQILNIKSGQIEHALTIEGVVKELYDVVRIPDAVCPKLIGFESDEIERVLSIKF